MKSLEVFRPQPDFPNEDIHEVNALYMKYLFRHEQSDRSYADHLTGSLRALHLTGHQALQVCGIDMDYSLVEYQAFCAGFADHEYTAAVVGQRVYDGELAVAKTRELLVEGDLTSDLEIAERFNAWRDLHPNTHDLIVDVGVECDETIQQLQSRAMGAALARELQVL